MHFWNWKVNRNLGVGFCLASFLLGLGKGCNPFPSFSFSAHAIARNGCKKYENATFGEKIVAIECSVGHWRTLNDLLQSQDFIAIYRHPSCYYDHLWTVLDSNWFTKRQKMIVVYAMEHLTSAEHGLLLEKGRQLYRSGRLSSEIWHILEAQPLAEKQNRSRRPAVPKILLNVTLDGILVAEQKRQNTTHPRLYRDMLLGYPDFVSIYTHPDAYFEEAMQCIQQERRSDAHYRLLFEAMTQLKAENYAQLVECFCNTYLNGTLPSNKLHLCILGEQYPYKKYFIDHYNHPEVQRVLRKIITHIGFPVWFKLRMADIQSGKTKIHRRCEGATHFPFVFHENVAGKWYCDSTIVLIIILFVLYKLLRFV